MALFVLFIPLSGNSLNAMFSNSQGQWVAEVIAKSTDRFSAQGTSPRQLFIARAFYTHNNESMHER
eukprot:1972107-Amphidinium_carterae.2